MCVREHACYATSVPPIGFKSSQRPQVNMQARNSFFFVILVSQLYGSVVKISIYLHVGLIVLCMVLCIILIVIF